MPHASEFLPQLPPTSERVCASCGKTFIARLIFTGYGIRCDECDKALREKLALEEAERKKQAIQSAWRSICPVSFRQTDPTRLPLPEKANETATWDGKQNLLLYGPTGKGKTRCAWLALKKHHEAGKNIAVMDSMSGLQYAAAYSESARDAEAWVRGQIDAEILFMDDIFKVKLTDSFECAIFTIVDQRMQRLKPIVLTCNDTGESLSARMTGDRAEPMLRRLRENAMIISF